VDHAHLAATRHAQEDPVPIAVIGRGHSQFVCLRPAYPVRHGRLFAFNGINELHLLRSFKDLTPLGGPALGLEYRHKVGTRLSFGIGLLAESKGFALHVDARQTWDRPPIDQSPDFQLRYTYLAIPLTMQWSFGHETYGLVSAGLAPAYAIAATGRIPLFGGAETNHKLQGEKPLVLDDHSRWDLEALAGIGIGHRIGEHWQLEMKATYLHGLVAIKSQYLLDPYTLRNRAGALLLSVGYHWGKG